jgi:hypothetical protein
MGSTTVTVELPRQLYRDLQALASREHADLTALLERLIKAPQNRSEQLAISSSSAPGQQGGAAPGDPNLLVGLSRNALMALAEGVLAPAGQARLTSLLERNRLATLTAAEERELSTLVEDVDQMNLVKARALYTLQKLDETDGPAT